MLSPRVWGWTGTWSWRASSNSVVPTRVGVDRKANGVRSKHGSCPHACGGGPAHRFFNTQPKELSPRVWGWTVGFELLIEHIQVVPTRVGVDRWKEWGGRRAEFTQAQVARAVAAAGGFVTSAAKRLGCDPKTVYRYMERYAPLKDVLGEARESSVDLAESKLMEAINAGNLTAVIFFLKTQGKSRGYVERSEHDFTASSMPRRFTIKIGEPLDKL